jgi:hypothetical protein
MNACNNDLSARDVALPAAFQGQLRLGLTFVVGCSNPEHSGSVGNEARASAGSFLGRGMTSPASRLTTQIIPQTFHFRNH